MEETRYLTHKTLIHIVDKGVEHTCLSLKGHHVVVGQ